MSKSVSIRAIILLQYISIALCQYPMQYPFPQSQPHMGGPIIPLPNLQPQPFMPQQMPLGFPMQSKMTSVVMPYYSKGANQPGKKYRKKRRKFKRYQDSWEADDSSESNSHEFRRSKKRRQVLTPVVSYITKDGYVVYQKKIKKDKAKDWLEMSKRQSQELIDSAEERKIRRMYKNRRD